MKLGSYEKLCTEFYDLDKPEASSAEVEFYSARIEKVNGPVLEAMCGSGRLLIPLLRKGHKVQGLDLSQEMLKSCKVRCQRAGLEEPELFHQSVTEFDIPERYALIFVAVGSFQLLATHEASITALTKFYEHLLPGGTLLLDTFIPSDYLKDDKNDRKSERGVDRPDGTRIVLNSSEQIDLLGQVSKGLNRYELVVNDQVVETEFEELYVRWYYRYEMEYLLKSAGFQNVRVFQGGLKKRKPDDIDSPIFYECERP